MPEIKRYRSVVADSARWSAFDFRPGDIVISTPPKCGTTWMQRLVALLVFGPELPGPLATLSPWLDMQLAEEAAVLAVLEAQQHRRFIKTHTPLDGLPFRSDVSYVVVGRDPRDVAVSSHNHMRNMDLDRFMAARAQAVGLDDLDELGFRRPGPRTTGDDVSDRLHGWLEEDDPQASPMSLRFLVHHLRTAWELQDQPNVVLFHYSDLLADLPGELIRLATFLGYELTPAEAELLASTATFSAMKAEAAQTAPNADIALWRDTAAFFNQGRDGQWREVFGSAELERYTDRLASLAPGEFADWLHLGWHGVGRGGRSTGGVDGAVEVRST